MAHYELRCRECGKTWGNQPRSICDDCFSPLEVTYDYDAVARRVHARKNRPAPPNMWRYSELLPLPEDYRAVLPVGFTPLLSAPHLGEKLGRAQALHQKRRRLPAHAEFQRSRGGGRAGPGARVWIRYGLVLLDRQPCELRGRAGRAQRLQSMDLHSRRS